jgi:hypothetical protein
MPAHNINTLLNYLAAEILNLLIQYRATLFDILIDLLQRVPLLRSLPGMYEVLLHDASLELLNRSGSRAVYLKSQRVRFLQNNIIAYQDKAWGDGDIFAEYRCSPGVDVDRYREGHRYNILISLRETRNRGDVEDFRIRRVIRGGFTQRVEEFQTEIDHRTRQLMLQVIFPANRLPTKVVLIEQNARRSTTLTGAHQRQMPNGKVVYHWGTDHPRLFEAYIMRWEW